MPVERRASDLVGRMTLEEKVSQMQNHSAAIPRLGIPEYDWWNEGLHGIARSGYATVFPQAIGLAATWDTDLLHEVAGTISTEARAKYNQAIRENIHSIYYGLTIWSPNINIFRDPRWGRGQETYGEDPYLTGRLAVAFITGLQGDDPAYLKTVATPKHFAVHSGPESSRHRFNVAPSPFDLEDTYLPQFRMAITAGRADSLMCAYNALDGLPACANEQLLGETLRKSWQFSGFVTSDCGAVSDFFSPEGHHFSADRAHAAAAAVRAGTDTSCGDEYAALVDAVHARLLTDGEIDIALKRLFTARFRLGMFDPPARVPYSRIPFRENDSPQHRALALEAAEKSMVLLKNENRLLPLGKKIGKIAVLGPNAASLSALEGNYNAVPSSPVRAVDGIAREFSGTTQVIYAQGAPYADEISLPVPRTVLRTGTGADAHEGLTGEYFANAGFRGRPALTRVDPELEFDWNSASPAPKIPAGDFSVRWTGVLAVPVAGEYSFDVGFNHCFPCFDAESYAVLVDGRQVARHATAESQSSRSSQNAPFAISFSDTRPHAICIEYSHHSKLFGAGLILNWRPPRDALLSGAVSAAQSADVVLAFVGLSPELEGEEMPINVAGFAGGDRTDIELPAAQKRMLEAVAATGKPLVVVLMNGSALAVNWAQQHAWAVLEAWYPGEAGGQAIAEVLSGRINPGGRLPVTFYASTAQLPPFDDYSMSNRTYRFFQGEPLYRFGYGLSYTHFTYSDLRLPSKEVTAGAAVRVEATVENDGKLPGDEVAELYLAPPGRAAEARFALKAFRRFRVAAGETQHVVFELDERQLSTVAADGSRSVRPGDYQVWIGGGQPVNGSGDVSGHFTVTGVRSLPR